MSESSQLYRTDRALKRSLRVAYPAGHGRIVLRTELDWNLDVEPTSVSEDGTISTFEVESTQPFLYFKVSLQRGDETHWSLGPNRLLLMTEADKRKHYPYFFDESSGRFSRLVELPSAILGRPLKMRAYLPPGYDENTLRSYPAAYMQDGQNLFFPEEAFMGHEWEVDETSQILSAMNAAEEVIFIGIHSGDRMLDYTRPGYEPYARSLAEEVVPHAESLIRLKRNRRQRSVWGSSLGGVVSFYAVWQHPEVFGVGVCMSSTFSHRDNLMERVLTEAPRDVAFYLDSGWPEDNYEVTMGMAMALVARGWTYGRNLVHLCFPMATHDETSWGMRLHLPLQFLNGAVAKASREGLPVLGDVGLPAPGF